MSPDAPGVRPGPATPSLPGRPGRPATPGAPGASSAPGTPATPPATAGPADDDWPFAFERYLHEWAPGVLQAQNAWMASIESLRAPDRKTHELIRMVCMVIARNYGGVELHARLAAEVGAAWDEIAGSVLLTEPAFGIMLAVESFPAARRGYKAARARIEASED